MAGTILADDIQHSTAGSVGTEYVVEGSAKAWVNFNGQGTLSVRNSSNISSVTDNGTGQYTVNFSTAFAAATYSAQVSYSVASGTGTSTRIDENNFNTGSCKFIHSDASFGDPEFVCCSFHGDQ